LTTPTTEATTARRAERDRRAWLTALTSFAGRGVSLGASLASLPLALGLLGKDRYGIWMALTGVLGWLSLADFGLGNGVTNQLASMHGEDDQGGARRVVSSAAGMVSAISLALTIFSLLLLLLVPWRSALVVPADVPQGELLATVGLCMGVFLVGFWLSPYERVFTAYQEGYLLNYFNITSSLLVLAGLAFCALIHPSMPIVVLVLSGMPLLPRLVGLAFLFGVRRPWLRPSRAAYDAATARSLLRSGFAFLIPQLAMIGAWESDNIIVLQMLGPAAVATYATVFRLPSTFSGVMSMWLGPLWPAYVEAAARGDIEWVRQKHNQSLLRSVGLASLGGVGLVALGRPVISIWTRGQIEPGFDLLLPMGLYLPLVTWCFVHSLALNGLGQLKGQAYYGVACAVVNILLSIYLARRVGLAGVSWATLIATCVPGALAYFELRYAFTRRTAEHQAAHAKA
jgi:O-antigen/teichoic acid export membrane protein